MTREAVGVTTRKEIGFNEMEWQGCGESNIPQVARGNLYVKVNMVGEYGVGESLIPTSEVESLQAILKRLQVEVSRTKLDFGFYTLISCKCKT